jgi:hypothetical protein
VAVHRGRLASARPHAEKARSIVGGVGSSTSWLGANAAAALGSLLTAERALAEAERGLAFAEHFFRDEVATVRHAWLLVLLARVRSRRGRLDRRRRLCTQRARRSPNLPTRDESRRSLPKSSSSSSRRACAPAAARSSSRRARQSSRCSAFWPPTYRLARSAQSCSSRPTRFGRICAGSIASSASTRGRRR